MPGAQWGGFLMLTQSPPDEQTVSPTGLDASPSFGSPQFNMVQAITGLDASATIGTVTVSPTTAVQITGFNPAASFGTVTWAANYDLALTGLDASPTFGTPEFDMIVEPTGLDASPNFGAISTTVQYVSKIDERIFFWKL